MKSASLTLMTVCLLCCQPKGNTASSKSQEPQPIGTAECAVCGMVVREQPAPRAQVIHRDHYRAYFCSIGDCLHYLRTPSPHGDAQIFVEGLPQGFDPADQTLTEFPWFPANQMLYQFGGERNLVMGTPVLSLAPGNKTPLLKNLPLKTWEELKTDYPY